MVAAQWQAKYEAKLSEVQRLRQGESSAGEARDSPNQLVQAISALTQEVSTARANNLALPPVAAEALETLTGLSAPYDAVGRFLQDVASGRPLPPVPRGLSPQVAEILEKLVDELNG